MDGQLNFAFFDSYSDAEDYALCMAHVGMSYNLAMNFIVDKWEVAYWK